MNSTCLSKAIVDSVRSVPRFSQKSYLPLHAPVFSGSEKYLVNDCLDSTFVSSVGTYVDQFEESISKFTHCDYAIATVNGTSALHISLLLAGVSSNDEVILPTLSFIATANSISYLGAIPHFVDSEETSLGIDPIALESWLDQIALPSEFGTINKLSGRCIKAIIPVHVFGHPCQIDEIIKVANKFNLHVIEDAAEALGSLYRDKHAGSYSSLASLSFNGNKIITTGGGGAILTSSTDYAISAKHLTTTAKVKHRWEFIHDDVGYNYRLPNINAALGCAQMQNLNSLIESKRILYNEYLNALAPLINSDDVQLLSEPPHSRSNYWLHAIRLSSSNCSFRDDILEYTNSNGVMTRPLWTPLHRQRPYSSCPCAPLPIADILSRQIINIPSSPCLS